MTDKFIKALSSAEGVADWKLTETNTLSRELFYVLDKLETSRTADITEYQATVYTDKDGKRGSASFSVYDFMTDEELASAIADHVYAASFAMNPYYDLPGKEELPAAEEGAGLADTPFDELITRVVRAVFAADTYREGMLSATEFFLTKTARRVVNSRGAYVSAVTSAGRVELIPSWEKNGDEVEIYHMMDFSSFDAEAITKEVDEQLRLARARFEAKPLPVKEGLKVIIQDDDAGRLFSYFIGDLSYAAKYMKSNKSEPGDCVQGDDITGDRLTLRLVPYYPNAFASHPFDDDGVILHDTLLIDNGIAAARHGSWQYGRYLGIERPTGVLPVTVVEPGTKGFDEMAKEPYVRCVRFSGLQVEPNSGYFGGEVRLGFYFDGKKEIPVTGFSISGNMNVSRGTMRLSSETVTRSRYHGPKYLEIPDMTIL